MASQWYGIPVQLLNKAMVLLNLGAWLQKDTLLLSFKRLGIRHTIENFSLLKFSKSCAVRYNAAKEKGINTVIIILYYCRELI